MGLRKMKIEWIAESPRGRNSMDIENFENEVLGRGTISVPLIVKENRRGSYDLIDGRKRFIAATRLVKQGFEVFNTVPVYVVPKHMTPGEIKDLVGLVHAVQTFYTTR